MDLPREIPPYNSKPLDPQLKLAARARIAHFVAKAHAQGVRLPMPTVSFDLRGTTAGQAFMMKNHLRLNAVLLAENPGEFLEQTVGHEVAHLATHVKHGRRVSAHGAEWKAMMVAFGLPPERCHSYDVSNARVGGSFQFVCGCPKPHVLGSRKARSARMGLLGCRRCGQKLTEPGATRTLGAGAHTPGAAAPHVSLRPGVPAPRTAPPVPDPRPRVELPTAPMLRYAQDLARKCELALPADVASDARRCSAFIEHAKALWTARAAGVTRTDAPTPRQVEFARKLARERGIEVPAAALASRSAISGWIDQQLRRSA